MGGKLVYADHLFNGYSTTKRDFTKQVESPHSLSYLAVVTLYQTPSGQCLHCSRQEREVFAVRFQVHPAHGNQDSQLQCVGLQRAWFHAGSDSSNSTAGPFPFHLEALHSRSREWRWDGRCGHGGRLRGDRHGDKGRHVHFPAHHLSHLYLPAQVLSDLSHELDSYVASCMRDKLAS